MIRSEVIHPETVAVWATMPQYAKKVERANGIIRDILAACQNPMVSFSCGKDSSVLAHLVVSIATKTPLRFLSSGETRLIHDVDKVIIWFKERGAIVDEICIDRVFSEEWKKATWTEQRKAGKRDIHRLNDGSWDLIFMGLRMEESRPRKISLLTHQSEGLPSFCHRYADASSMSGRVRCCPLADWTTLDIAAYLSAHSIPVLSWYEQHGIGSRTTARLTGDSVRQNVLTWLKSSNPAGFAKLKARFPEFGLYV